MRLMVTVTADRNCWVLAGLKLYRKSPFVLVFVFFSRIHLVVFFGLLSAVCAWVSSLNRPLFIVQLAKWHTAHGAAFSNRQILYMFAPAATGNE
jgi:hypothetical protein